MSEAASQATGSEGRDFVLSRELAEVFLLLDFIASSTDRSLADMRADADKELDKDWLERLNRIRWPPKAGEKRDFAAEAALVIKAKDFLNRCTHPATGATIAFTLLVTQEDPDGGDEAQAEPAAPGAAPRPKGLWPFRFGAGRKARPPPAAPPPSRTSLAWDAYPGLVPKAKGFRRGLWWMSLGLVAWLGVTCVLSWYTAFGNANLTQLASVSATLEKALQRVSEAEAADKGPQKGAASSAGAANADPAAPSGTTDTAVVPLCLRPLLIEPAHGAQLDIRRFTNVQEMQACQDLSRANSEMTRVRESLVRWVKWYCIAKPLCPGLEITKRPKPVTPSPDPNVARPLIDYQDAVAAPGGTEAGYASALAAILGAAVLPVFYGILGAGAAIIRTVSAKMLKSQLAPRDMALSIQRLALGAVVGASIGLFVTSSATGAEGSPGLLGTVALSGSALSFVGGFSVEAVFTALEALINRIFEVRPK